MDRTTIYGGQRGDPITPDGQAAKIEEIVMPEVAYSAAADHERLQEYTDSIDRSIAEIRRDLFALADKILAQPTPSSIVIMDASGRFIGLFVSTVVAAAAEMRGAARPPTFFIKPPDLEFAEAGELSAFESCLAEWKAGGVSDFPLVVREYTSFANQAGVLLHALASGGGYPSYASLFVHQGESPGDSSAIRALVERCGGDTFLVGRTIADSNEVRSVWRNYPLNGVVSAAIEGFGGVTYSRITGWAAVAGDETERATRFAAVRHSRRALSVLVAEFLESRR
jgi:hypothetical protein